MSKRKPVNWMTRPRLMWLRHLERFGTDRREGWRKAPYECMQLGWTEWVDLENADYRERLTPLGREALTSHDAANALKHVEATNGRE